MVRIINLNSPILDIIETVNIADISELICFVVEKNGDVTFLSSCKELNLLVYAKLEIEKEIQSLIDKQFTEENV